MGNLEKYKFMMESLKNTVVANWLDIDNFLESIKKADKERGEVSLQELLLRFNSGIAFLTFDYGIDGVSIEISKYAQCFENFFKEKLHSSELVPLHFIGGDFNSNADAVIKPHWNRFEVKGINGWSKWFGGGLFGKLYYEDMPENSQKSQETAQEVWNQACEFAEKIGAYITENNISLLFPVNIFSNPGNLALTLAGIIVSEILELNVFNSNHDFYWEGGMPPHERGSSTPGPRDHFFKNCDNKKFFQLFKKIYPWNGDLWAQVNINTQQSEALEREFGFSQNSLFELSTSVSDEFFKKYSSQNVKTIRNAMAHILSDGQSVINTIGIDEHLRNLSNWMNHQKPLVCSAIPDIKLDITSDEIIYSLQPTRIIARKRIEKDIDLFSALLNFTKFSDEFLDSNKKLILHITGPVPIEHEDDTRRVLIAYKKLISSLPEKIAVNVFVAFSVGTEYHSSFDSANIDRLHIEDIYRLADIILFPSETEGRGLPIIESCACGIPIVCSRYYPKDVFEEVTGEHLPDELRIKYILFPEEDFTDEILDFITSVLLKKDSEKLKNMIEHNKKAVYERYGTGSLLRTFKDVFKYFEETLANRK